jgi:hypothetical protein
MLTRRGHAKNNLVLFSSITAMIVTILAMLAAPLAIELACGTNFSLSSIKYVSGTNFSPSSLKYVCGTNYSPSSL